MKIAARIQPLVAYTYVKAGRPAANAGNLAMAQHQPIRKASAASGSEIPDKLYFRIGDVAKLCDVPAYVLRFWESEFPQLKPHKGGTGQRLYRKRDVEMALRIKTLLYDEGYTIPGARQVFKSELKQRPPQMALAIESEAGAATAPRVPMDTSRQLKQLKKELHDLHGMLSRPPGRSVVHAMRPQRTGTVRKPATVQQREAEGRLFDLSFSDGPQKDTQPDNTANDPSRNDDTRK